MGEDRNSSLNLLVRLYSLVHVRSSEIRLCLCGTHPQPLVWSADLLCSKFSDTRLSKVHGFGVEQVVLPYDECEGFAYRFG